MLWFLANYIIIYFLQDSKIPFSTKTAASLSTHTGLNFAADVFLLIESEGIGINWSSLNRKVNNYTLGTNIGMTFVNIAIFLILSIYAD